MTVKPSIRPEDLPLSDALAIGAQMHRQYLSGCMGDVAVFKGWLEQYSMFDLHDACALMLLACEHPAMTEEGQVPATTTEALTLLELLDGQEDFSDPGHIAWSLLQIGPPLPIAAA